MALELQETLIPLNPILLTATHYYLLHNLKY